MQFLVITIDTEGDSPKWEANEKPTLNNIEALLRLQNLFDIYKAKPTFLLTYDVVQDQPSVEIIKSVKRQARGRMEIGAHLHPWNNPPFLDEKDKEKLGYAHRSKYEFEKLRELTFAIEKAFGRRPVSYRAGRYGFDENSLKCLEQWGYKIDTSITPGINWQYDKGPNFASFKRVAPYFLSRENIAQAGESALLEVPLSIISFSKGPYFLQNIYGHLPLRVKAVLKKANLARTIWLRPAISSFEEMKIVSDYLLRKNVNVLNIMFHSNELIAGCSPYVEDQAQEDEVFTRLDKILHYLLKEKGFVSKTLSELYQEYKKDGEE